MSHGQGSFQQRLAEWLDHLAHVLPAQAPIRDFVHHNTLHGFQHLPFAEALAAAHALTGARPYWEEANFRQALAAGRITRDDLLAAFDELALGDGATPIGGGLCRQDIWLACLQLPDDDAAPDVFRRPGASTASDDWRADAASRWQHLSQALGVSLSWRSLLRHLAGEDVLDGVRVVLQRQLAAHLDAGIAAWRNPASEQGFYAAWKASAGLDLAWELDELPGIREDILHLPDDPAALLEATLRELLPEPAAWFPYLQRLALELPGWSGMVLWRASHPGVGDVPVSMVDYLAVRLFLEHRLCTELVRRLTGAPLSLAEFLAYYQSAPGEFIVRHGLACGVLPEDLAAAAAGLCQVAETGREVGGWEALAPRVSACLQAAEQVASARRLACLLQALALPPEALEEPLRNAIASEQARLDALLRGQIWLAAYEHHYREQIFAALAANARRSLEVPACSAQVVFCMDDREEGTRRHLEEIAPDVQTFGVAGFFGVAMYWRGVDDAAPSALCPVVVTPRHQVEEQPEDAIAWQRHAARREWRLRWRERLYQARRAPLAGPLLTTLAGLPALFALTASSLAPAWLAASMARWQRLFDGKVRALPQLSATTAEDGPLQQGFTDAEQVDRVAALLRTIGLTRDFAPLVLMLGHGSHSLNNPHRSAYDCGACSGRHGGPNARVFALMANRPEVRAGLARQGIVIPDGTRFVAAEHDTCDDSIEWYDLEEVPAAWQAPVDRLLAQLGEACRWHAVERCRRLASAPERPTPWQARRHVAGRAADLSQARPELGHATNAAAFIGRRAMSRGLFLDRRVFLISYDPAQDADGSIVENILLAAGPVGAGIALEYYFSTVDNATFGCGSKVTHNLAGLFGVMDGTESDLRTGLPWQMVEVHEPMRLLVVVEQSCERLSAILARQPALQELVGNAWIQLAAQDPLTHALSRYCPRRGWLAWAGRPVLPQVARSVDWFGGEKGPLAPALLLGAAG